MSIRKITILLLDIIFIPFTLLSAILLKSIRIFNITPWRTHSQISKYILEMVGIFPITNHYYEPAFKYNKNDVLKERILPGINFNIANQLIFLNNFTYNSELINISKLPLSQYNYSYINSPFKAGDSCILYNMVRFTKPKNIIEIGCGSSTLMIQHAIKDNIINDSNYNCNHYCIEPYENKWLENLNLNVIRQKVETLDISFFKNLDENDILFIDSSHIIRPGGDVLFEFLEILPILNKNVYIHIHDIFTPNNYLHEWLIDGVNFWNEQYLLEAFLSCNEKFEIVLSLNFLKNNYFDILKEKSPLLNKEHEPGSIWLKKIV